MSLRLPYVYSVTLFLLAIAANITANKLTDIVTVGNITKSVKYVANARFLRVLIVLEIYLLLREN